MNRSLILERNQYVYLKEKGEICNRLSKGTQVYSVKRKGEWLKIFWRNGKKKGWIYSPEEQ